jgi:two-component system sensor histidine kinase/response regulator
VTDNQGRKPYNGFLVFTRAFSPSLQTQIKKRTQLALTFHPIAATEVSTPTGPPNAPYSASVSTVGQEIVGEGIVRDLNHIPILSISHRAPRTIYQQGIASRNYVVFLMAMCLVVANGVLIAFLNRIVIGRLERFASKIKTIASTTDFTLRVEQDGSDEIGSLTHTFNGLLTTTEETTNQLAHARDAALRATHAKSAFVAHVSHELRTPIHGLSGLLRILFKGESSPSKRAYIQMAQDSAGTLLSTINSILDLSKIESGAIDLQHIPFSVRQVVRTALRTVAPRIDEKPLIHFLLDIAPGVPDAVIGDSLRFQQILINLLGNAAKFTQQGTISLRMSPRSVAPSQTTIIFEIADTGIGMSQEHISRIFKPYVQADDTIQSTYGGTGLGLSLVKGLIDQLGGTISVASILQQGTTFTIELPFSRDNRTEAPLTAYRATQGLVIDHAAPFSSWMTAGLARYQCSLQRISPTDEGALTYLIKNPPSVDFILISSQALETPLVNEYLRRLRESVKCPLIASLRASDMAAHERMHAFGDIKIIDSPTAPEEVLSLARHAAKAAVSEQTRQSLTPKAGDAPCRILVADDAATSRLIIREMLEEAGYEVETVENGEQLVRRVAHDINHTSDTPISIVITDIEMPIMGGLEATRAIRALERDHPDRTSLPIIAVTAHALIEEQQRFLNGGISYTVTKPLKPSDLNETLTRIATQDFKNEQPPMNETQPVSLPSALRDLTDRLWRDVQQHRPLIKPPVPSHGIDITDVFERSGDSPRRTKLILNAFLSCYHGPLEKLQDISKSAPSKDLTLAAHALKGLLLDVGAKHAATLAASIERALKDGDHDSAVASWELVKEETPLVATLIERVIRHFPSTEPS